MGIASGNDILTLVLICAAGSLVLAALGMWLHRTRRLTSRAAALICAVIAILPPFGAGFLMMTKQVVEQATGVTGSRVNSEPNERLRAMH